MIFSGEFGVYCICGWFKAFINDYVFLYFLLRRFLDMVSLFYNIETSKDFTYLPGLQ